MAVAARSRRLALVVARIAPGLPVPFWAYLDLDRVCGQPDTRRRFLTDSLGLQAYPLGFLAELFTGDLSGMRDSSIACPVLVIACQPRWEWPATAGVQLAGPNRTGRSALGAKAWRS